MDFRFCCFFLFLYGLFDFFIGEEIKMRQRTTFAIFAILLIVISASLLIAWNQLYSKSDLHLTYTVSNIIFNGTHLNVTIHFFLPDNESFRCNGLKDLDAKVTSFTERTFYDGDSLTLKFPALGISSTTRGAVFWLLIVTDKQTIDFPIIFEVPASQFP